MVIEWTEEARKRVQARRVEDLGPLAGVDPQADWATLREEARRRSPPSSVDPALVPALERLAARLEAIEPATDLSRDELALWLRLTESTAALACARFALATHGLERTVEAFVHTTSIALRAAYGGATLAVATTLVRPVSLPGLREALLRASAELYARCRAHVEPVLARLDITGRAVVVKAFPHEAPWAEELARELLASIGTRSALPAAAVIALHGALTDVELARELTLRAGAGSGDLESLIDVLGERAIQIVMELAKSAHQQHELERVARALSVVRTPEVAALLAAHIGKNRVRKHAGDFFRRFPELAEAALGPIAKGKTRAAAMAQELLAQHGRAASDTTFDEAPLEALPAVLVTPPWDGGARHKRRPLVVRGLALEGPVAYHGAFVPLGSIALAEMNEQESAEWRRDLEAYDPRVHQGPRPTLFTHYARQRRVPADARLRAWNEDAERAPEPSATVAGLLSEAGVAALPGVVSWARRVLPTACSGWPVRVLEDVEMPALAPELALVFSRRVLRELVTSWMRRYPEAAIAGLVPIALGETCARRTACERMLRRLAAQGLEARIRARAEELGPRGAEAIDEVLSSDPLADCPAKPPKLSVRYRPEALLRPTTRDGLQLPLAAVRRLGEMLAFSSPELPYAGLELVREACDPRSLAEHAWSLAVAWEASGARKTDQWMMLSLVHLADDEVVRRMTPALKNGLVVEVLAHLGTDAAAMELATVAARGASAGSAFGAMREKAEQALDRIARAQGIERDQLDERLTPTLGLDARGGLALDYGGRVLRVSFDEHLGPEVVDEEGARTRQLPRARKGDDPAAVERARRMWDELREDVGAIALLRIEALERAMLVDRTWSVEDFETYWARHPLMLHLARRLVFAAHRERAPARTFRVAEDGTYADRDDAGIALHPDDRVSIPHPLRWPDESLPRWIERLDDYEIIQPFAQLTRRPPAVSPEERASTAIVRPQAVDWARLRWSLTRCGWSTRLGAPFSLDLAGDRTVAVETRQRSGGGAGATPTHEVHLTLRREGALLPWTEASEDELARVLDVLGAA